MFYHLREILLASVAAYGYPALALGVLLENAGVPVPGETLLITAAVLARSGRLSIVPVVLVAAVAAMVGDNVGYAVGRFGGRQLVERWGRWVFITPERLDRGERFVERWGAPAVFAARFVLGVRVVAALVAGSVRMPWPRFVAANALGAIAWATAVGWAAYTGALVAERTLPALHLSHAVVWTVAVAGALVVVLVGVVRRRRSA